jgi:hypothetical protein
MTLKIPSAVFGIRVFTTFPFLKSSKSNPPLEGANIPYLPSFEQQPLIKGAYALGIKFIFIRKNGILF